MRKTLTLIGVLIAFICLQSQSDEGCTRNSSDRIQRQQQERILQEGTAQIGMPAIKNFREKKLVKDILELRDQEGLITYTYLFADNTGKLIFLGETIGYGIPCATQFTNPQKPIYDSVSNSGTIAQADPNGLFSPASAEGTWIMMLDPVSNQARPQYIEPRVLTLTFKLADTDPRLK